MFGGGMNQIWAIVRGDSLHVFLDIASPRL